MGVERPGNRLHGPVWRPPDARFLPLWQAVAGHRSRSKRVVVMSEESYVGCFRHAPLKAPKPSPTQSPGAPGPSPAGATLPVADLLVHYGSMATCGPFVYVHSRCGLFKLGSGMQGTMQGLWAARGLLKRGQKARSPSNTRLITLEHVLTSSLLWQG